MNLLPEEVLSLVFSFSSNTCISSLKSVSKCWLNCIVKYQDELYNTNIIRCLDLDIEKYRKPIQLRTNKIYKIIRNKYGIPKYMVIINNQYHIFDLYDFSEKHAILVRDGYEFGTDFILNIGDTICDMFDKCIDRLPYDCEKSYVVNDYIFTFIEKKRKIFLCIGDIDSFKERDIMSSGFFKELLWHAFVTNVIYQNNKYIIISSGSFVVLDNKFNILHVVYTKYKFVYACDTFYIVKDKKYKICEYSTNKIIQEIDCPNCITYIIYNHMYFINNDGVVKVYNLVLNKFEDTVEMDRFYIYEFNDHFILFKKGHKLYCIDF
jgi:hypothetical protein